MENIEKREQLYEGKAKKVYATNDPNLVIVDYKDDATAFNGSVCSKRKVFPLIS